MLVDLGAFPALIPGDGSGVLGSPSKRNARLDLARVMFVGCLPQRIHGSTHNLQIDGHFTLTWDLNRILKRAFSVRLRNQANRHTDACWVEASKRAENRRETPVIPSWSV